jgi:C4-dicarboxylate transporter, DctM subunit
VYAALVTRYVYRDLSWREIVQAASQTAYFTSQILIVVACASIFAWLLTVNQLPAALVGWLQGLELSTWQVLLAINVLLLLVGCFIDPLSAILILTPVGVHPIHFGIVMTVNLAIGLFHPPFGINIFVAQSVLGLPLKVIYRGIVPFLLIYLVALALITYVPAISLAGMHLFF